MDGNRFDGGEVQPRGYSADALTDGRSPETQHFQGPVVHVELGGITLSNRFRAEAMRLGIVIDAGTPERAWPFVDPGGTVLLTVDPCDMEPALTFVKELRGRGSRAGVVAVAGPRGLRRTTCAPLRRAGVDRFVALSADAAEFARHLRAAVDLTVAGRGGACSAPLLRWSQPRSADGSYRLMTTAALVLALRERLSAAPHDRFALCLLRLREPPEKSWELLHRWLRLRDGDLLAVLPGRGLALALEEAGADVVGRVLARLFQSRPGLSAAEAVTTLELPRDRELLLAVLRRWEGAGSPAHGPNEGIST